MLIGGDFFDGPAVDFYSITEPFKSIQSTHGIYFVSGNHESYQPHQPYIPAIKNAGIKVLMNEWETIDGVTFAGIDYLSSDDANKQKALMENMHIPKDHPVVLVKHVPVDMKIAYDVGVDLQLSGHTHQGQLWPFSLITKKMYKGYDFGLNNYPRVADTNKKQMKIYTSSGAFGWGPPYRIGTKNEIVVIHFVQ
ncbi:MAG: hypothetical protein RL094_678 [Candidatus Parcubacteria bacterium]